MEDKISLIITFSEAYDEETKQNVISQITGDKELLDLFQMTKDRIFFMGSISVWESRSKDEIQKTTIAANVKQLRASLFEFIFAHNEYYDVKKLPLYLERLSLIDMIIEKLCTVGKDAESATLIAKVKRLLDYGVDKSLDTNTDNTDKMKKEL